MPASNQVRQIKVVVDTSNAEGLREMASKFSALNKSVQSLSNGFGNLQTAFLGYLSIQSVQKLAGISDSIQLVRDRINGLSGSAEEGSRVFDNLIQVASRTRVGIDSIAETYARFASATKSTKVNSDTLLATLEVLQNSFRLSGASAEEAQGSTIQLSQAFSLGKLQGQELRSVMLGNTVVAQLLKDRFGNVAKAAEQGLITPTELFKVLLGAAERVNGEAQKLGVTFGQSVTGAMNDFKVAVENANRSLGLSAGFAKGMQVLRDNADFVAVAIGALAITVIPAAVAALGSMGLALTPVSAAFLAFSLDITNISRQFGGLINYFKILNASIYDFDVGLKGQLAKNLESLNFKGVLDDQVAALKRSANESEVTAFTIRREVNQNIDDLEKRAALLANPVKPNIVIPPSPPKTEEDKLAKLLGRLNIQFKDKIITANQYYDALDKFEKLRLDRNFRDGKIELDKYNESLEKFKQQDITRQFQRGKISITEFNKAIEQSKLAQLNFQFEAGRISLSDYNEKLTEISTKLEPGAALYTGVQKFYESIGNVNKDIVGGITSAFNVLETSLLEFVQTGTFNFKNFANSILTEMEKIIIRAAIIRPLTEGLLGALGGGGGAAIGAQAGGSYANVGNVAAKGMAFDSGVRKFAKGGIVSTPTAFSYGGGQRGLMGEAGTEAILPLARKGNGNLGVEASVTPVNISINNYSNSEVQQQETTGPNGERSIEILILNKTREAIAGGQLDKVMGNSFGLKRKGT